MNRLSTYILALAVVVAFAGQSFATPTVARDKAFAGAKDIITSPLHVKDDVLAQTKDKAAHIYPLALAGGLLKGSFYMGKQMVDGAVAMVTSPLEITK